MTDPITPATIARLRELTGWRGNSDDDGEHEEDLDLADWQIRAIYSALQSGAIPIPDDAPQLAAQAAEIERLKEAMRYEQDRANDAARGSLRYREAVNADRDRAEARVAELRGRVEELEGLLRKHAALACGACMGTGSYLGDEDRDGPCDACGGTGHVLPEDVAAVLAGREGGR